MSSDSHSRTFLKTILWRVVATAITGTTLFVYTHNAGQATEAALSAAALSTAAYYLYERVWNGVKWGKIETKQRS